MPMIVSCKLPPHFADRLRIVMAWRKQSSEYGHLRNIPGDIMRDLLGEWVKEQEREMTANE